ncbi:hypothetical protein TIFTF001_040037 [Ficus carica]|uniref:Uncharacterized protein n=1 Tax=Ficus carica TaxID=3494 RepID=A0AA87ZAR4_FICCA|nr:hypothetical protein TIFTF001_040037 [Ficus carica]
MTSGTHWNMWERAVRAKHACAWGQLGPVGLGGVQTVTCGEGRDGWLGSARELADGLFFLGP